MQPPERASFRRRPRGPRATRAPRGTGGEWPAPRSQWLSIGVRGRWWNIEATGAAGRDSTAVLMPAGPILAQQNPWLSFAQVLVNDPHRRDEWTDLPAASGNGVHERILSNAARAVIDNRSELPNVGVSVAPV